MKEKEVILGICGGISAYKAPALVRALKKKQANVTCILTANGERFVTELTLKTLSNNNVYKGMFDEYEPDIKHISLAKKADIVVIVPATADAISRLAAGRADDLLSSVVLGTKAPVLICPAMNENMWLHASTKKNIEVLKSYGYKILLPQKGSLACGDEGVGRLESIEKIAEEIENILSKKPA